MQEKSDAALFRWRDLSFTKLRQMAAGLKIRLRTETLALIASIYFALACNASFWIAIEKGAPNSLVRGGVYFICLFVLLTALQFILLTLMINRWTAKPVLFVLIMMTVAATYFMGKFGIYLDTDMVRNALNTDWRETRELLSLDMIPYFFTHATLPLAFIFFLQIRIEPLKKSWWVRPAAIVLAIVVTALSVAPISQTLIPQVRENKGLRHLITPGNYIMALARLSADKPHLNREAREVIGLDAKKITTANEKPLLLVIALGETVRGENWGLNGYSRQTTPRLAALNVINFSDTTACGTNTEVSVPCLFSSYGRRNYDLDKIRNSESVLHILERAGVHVQWRDNQSGCKGVCDGLEMVSTSSFQDPALCNADGCFDAVLLNGLDEQIQKKAGDQAIVMHQMGNHGPSYHLRYPESFKKFSPDCLTSNLGDCTTEQIINSYDNAILYTDDVLANTISLLSKFSSTHRVAMLYVSDHGESLGEHGLYLHSIPYSIAPSTQTHVPMVLWMANSMDFGINAECMQNKSKLPASHDNVFHTVLGLGGIQTSAYDAEMDLAASCRVPTKTH